MIHYIVDMDSLTRIERDLGMMKDKSRIVLRNAINKTAKEAVELLVDEAGKAYYVKRKTSVRKTIDVKKAKVSDLVALITSKGKVNELYDFKVSSKNSNPPIGHRANVRRSNPPKLVYLRPGSTDQYKAFAVKYKNGRNKKGHRTIAQRVPGKKMKNNPNKEAIKTLYSNSVPKMLEMVYGEDVQGAVAGRANVMIYESLQKNIQEQILRFLG